MELPYLLSLVSPRLRDRARALAFFRFLGRRFLDDELFQAAGALSFTTLFALVPLSMVVFGALSAFESLRPLSRQLADYVFSNYVPGVARSAQNYLLQIAASNTGKLTSTGVVALVISVLVTLTSVETTFNNIWRVKAARPKFGRFLVYWTVLTLGAVFAAASLAISARFFAMAMFATRAGHVLESFMLSLTPLLIEVAAFATMYRVVPHRTVKWRHALSGAALATLGFELAKWGMGAYLTSFNSYAKIYQQLAIIPIFLLWVYVGWVAILLGASFAASVSAFRYQPASQRLPPGYEIYGLLRMLARFDEARHTGKGLHADAIQRMEPMLTDAMIQQFIAQLSSIHVLQRAETGEWLLTRDLDTLTLAELYEACHLRIPIAEAHLPCRDDALGAQVTRTIDDLRIPLRDLLKRRVNTVWSGDSA
ncbi:YihY family inner membrane protein [Cognatilysobacter terrigena]|uniref:YihY family inner membrane protein n=1 Tax=Cognatilysobacter terrigena TaxID=2488749 RepID=UPI0010601929|nr:YihY family inner membrane protein [Lysobacter terrigena]